MSIGETGRWFAPGIENLSARRDLSPLQRCALDWLGVRCEALRDSGVRGPLQCLLVGDEVIVATTEPGGRPALELWSVEELAALHEEARAML